MLTWIGNVASAISGCFGTEEAKNCGLDVVRVVQLQECVDAAEDVFVGVLSRDRTSLDCWARYGTADEG